VHSSPGKSFLPAAHPGAKVRWNAPKDAEAKSAMAEVVVPVAETEAVADVKVAA